MSWLETSTFSDLGPVSVVADGLSFPTALAFDPEGVAYVAESGLPFGGATGTGVTTVDLKLPSYEVVNLSAGVEMDDGLDLVVYVNNLFDENALLSFDRERGGRARVGYTIGQPRTYGVTARKAF